MSKEHPRSHNHKDTHPNIEKRLCSHAHEERLYKHEEHHHNHEEHHITPEEHHHAREEHPIHEEHPHNHKEHRHAREETHPICEERPRNHAHKGRPHNHEEHHITPEEHRHAREERPHNHEEHHLIPKEHRHAREETHPIREQRFHTNDKLPSTHEEHHHTPEEDHHARQDVHLTRDEHPYIADTSRHNHEGPATHHSTRGNPSHHTKKVSSASLDFCGSKLEDAVPYVHLNPQCWLLLSHSEELDAYVLIRAGSGGAYALCRALKENVSQVWAGLYSSSVHESGCFGFLWGPDANQRLKSGGKLHDSLVSALHLTSSTMLIPASSTLDIQRAASRLDARELVDEEDHIDEQAPIGPVATGVRHMVQAHAACDPSAQDRAFAQSHKGKLKKQKVDSPLAPGTRLCIICRTRAFQTSHPESLNHQIGVCGPCHGAYANWPRGDIYCHLCGDTSPMSTARFKDCLLGSKSNNKDHHVFCPRCVSDLYGPHLVLPPSEDKAHNATVSSSASSLAEPSISQDKVTLDPSSTPPVVPLFSDAGQAGSTPPSDNETEAKRPKTAGSVSDSPKQHFKAHNSPSCPCCQTHMGKLPPCYWAPYPIRTQFAEGDLLSFLRGLRELVGTKLRRLTPVVLLERYGYRQNGTLLLTMAQLAALNAIIQVLCTPLDHCEDPLSVIIGVGLFLRMGEGKTIILLVLADHVIQCCGPLPAPIAVIASITGTQPWADELCRYFPWLSAAIVAGGIKHSETERALQDMSWSPVLTPIVVFNPLWREDRESLFVDIPYAMVFADEATFLKNHKSHISTYVRRLVTPFRVAATGTPNFDSDESMFDILNFVHPSKFPANLLPRYASIFYEFHRHCEMAVSGEVDAAEIDFTDLQELVGDSVVAMNEEASARAYNVSTVNISISVPASRMEHIAGGETWIDKAKRVNDSTIAAPSLSESTTTTGKHSRSNTHDNSEGQDDASPALHTDYDSNATPASRRTVRYIRQEIERMSKSTTDQICSISEKLCAVRYLAEPILAAGESLVISANFISQEVPLYCALFHSLGVKYDFLVGNTPAAERARMLKAFQAKLIRTMILSTEVGAHALNLDTAFNLICTTPDWTPEKHLQLTYRVMRRSQVHNVILYNLSLAGSIDEYRQVVADHKNAAHTLARAGLVQNPIYPNEAPPPFILAVGADVTEMAILGPSRLRATFRLLASGSKAVNITYLWRFADEPPISTVEPVLIREFDLDPSFFGRSTDEPSLSSTSTSTSITMSLPISLRINVLDHDSTDDPYTSDLTISSNWRDLVNQAHTDSHLPADTPLPSPVQVLNLLRLHHRGSMDPPKAVPDTPSPPSDYDPSMDPPTIIKLLEHPPQLADLYSQITSYAETRDASANITYQVYVPIDISKVAQAHHPPDQHPTPVAPLLPSVHGNYTVPPTTTLPHEFADPMDTGHPDPSAIPHHPVAPMDDSHTSHPSEVLGLERMLMDAPVAQSRDRVAWDWSESAHNKPLHDRASPIRWVAMITSGNMAACAADAGLGPPMCNVIHHRVAPFSRNYLHSVTTPLCSFKDHSEKKCRHFLPGGPVYRPNFVFYPDYEDEPQDWEGLFHGLDGRGVLVEETTWCSYCCGHQDPDDSAEKTDVSDHTQCHHQHIPRNLDYVLHFTRAAELTVLVAPCGGFSYENRDVNLDVMRLTRGFNASNRVFMEMIHTSNRLCPTSFKFNETSINVVKKAGLDFLAMLLDYLTRAGIDLNMSGYDNEGMGLYEALRHRLAMFMVPNSDPRGMAPIIEHIPPVGATSGDALNDILRHRRECPSLNHSTVVRDQDNIFLLCDVAILRYNHLFKDVSDLCDCLSDMKLSTSCTVMKLIIWMEREGRRPRAASQAVAAVHEAWKHNFSDDYKDVTEFPPYKFWVHVREEMARISQHLADTGRTTHSLSVPITDRSSYILWNDSAPYIFTLVADRPGRLTHLRGDAHFPSWGPSTSSSAPPSSSSSAPCSLDLDVLCYGDLMTLFQIAPYFKFLKGTQPGWLFKDVGGSTARAWTLVLLDIAYRVRRHRALPRTDLDRALEHLLAEKNAPIRRSRISDSHVIFQLNVHDTNSPVLASLAELRLHNGVGGIISGGSSRLPTGISSKGLNQYTLLPLSMVEEMRQLVANWKSDFLDHRSKVSMPASKPRAPRHGIIPCDEHGHAALRNLYGSHIPFRVAGMLPDPFRSPFQRARIFIQDGYDHDVISGIVLGSNFQHLSSFAKDRIVLRCHERPYLYSVTDTTSPAEPRQFHSDSEFNKWAAKQSDMSLFEVRHLKDLEIEFPEEELRNAVNYNKGRIFLFLRLSRLFFPRLFEHLMTCYPWQCDAYLKQPPLDSILVYVGLYLARLDADGSFILTPFHSESLDMTGSCVMEQPPYFEDTTLWLFRPERAPGARSAACARQTEPTAPPAPTTDPDLDSDPEEHDDYEPIWFHRGAPNSSGNGYGGCLDSCEDDVDGYKSANYLWGTAERSCASKPCRSLPEMARADAAWNADLVQRFVPIELQNEISELMISVPPDLEPYASLPLEIQNHVQPLERLLFHLLQQELQYDTLPVMHITPETPHDTPRLITSDPALKRPELGLIQITNILQNPIVAKLLAVAPVMLRWAICLYQRNLDGLERGTYAQGAYLVDHNNAVACHGYPPLAMHSSSIAAQLVSQISDPAEAMDVDTSSSSSLSSNLVDAHACSAQVEGRKAWKMVGVDYLDESPGRQALGRFGDGPSRLMAALFGIIFIQAMGGTLKSRVIPVGERLVKFSFGGRLYHLCYASSRMFIVAHRHNKPIDWLKIGVIFGYTTQLHPDEHRVLRIRPVKKEEDPIGLLDGQPQGTYYRDFPLTANSAFSMYGKFQNHYTHEVVRWDPKKGKWIPDMRGCFVYQL
eukprot:TRINITY_DN2603_c0_g1_i5.p1 TRINITY_DN2603_c0_g1~~TRINITY_DN2603_c0_g1_i5.p1  ORF type:complete len:2879 (+),score=370.82 TRINITY_DN2603_c0_g1_i5:747-9383(+)